MSKAVGAVVGAVVGFFAAPFIGVALAVGVIAGAALGAMTSDTIMAIISPGAFDSPSNIGNTAAAQQNQGVTLNNQGTNISIPVVYGRRKIGGTRVFVSSAGDRNANLYVALVLAEGEIAGLEKIYLDDTLVYDGGLTSHGSSYGVGDTKYKNLVTFQVFHGTANQTASSLLKEAGSWNDNCKLTGLAYIACKFTYPQITDQASTDANPWTSGIPKINAQVRGRVIADCTGFGSGATRATAYASESVAFNDNPVNCLLDYLRNPIYGKGLSNDQINFGSFRDNIVKWDKDSSSNTVADNLKHRFNGVLFTDRTIMDNVKAVLAGMRSSLPYTQGRYRLQVEDNGNANSVYFTSSSSVMTLNHDNLLTAINIESESTQKKYNRVVVTYMGGGEGTNTPTYEPIEITYPTPGSAEEATFLAEDNDRLNEYTITLEHITSSTTAQKMAEIILLKSRTRGKVLGFTADSSAAKLDVGDIVTVQYGYDTLGFPGDNFTLTTPAGLVINGTFRITNIAVNNDYTFGITAAEHADNVYGGTPVKIANPQSIVRADAGSGIVADVYRPSSTGIPTPVVTFGETFASFLNGQASAGASFFINYIGDGSVYETDIYLKRPQDNHFVWIQKETPAVDGYGAGDVPRSSVTIFGLQYETTYSVRFQHRNYVGSVSAPATIEFVTVRLGSNTQVNPYNSLTVFT